MVTMTTVHLLLQMWEGRLQQVGDVLLDVCLVVGRTAGAQCDTDLPLLHQVEHVSQDGGVHGQTCTQRSLQFLSYDASSLPKCLIFKSQGHMTDEDCVSF